MAWKSSRQMLGTGERAPAFELQDVRGGKRSLDEILAGGAAVLAFFKITCPTCQLIMPFLERMAASDKLQFIAVSQDGVKGTEEFRQEYGMKFPTLIDSAGEGYVVSNAYGITHVPSVFVVERDGGISASFNGFSKKDVEALGLRAGIEPFRASDYVPEWKAG